MASTYSNNLAIELIGTGDQSGTWGTTTNTNLGTLIEQAISGYVTQFMSDSADTTITIPNGASGVARNMSLELTGSLTATRNLIVPTNPKLYFIYNNTGGGLLPVTVKTSSGTGVSVPNGKKMVLVSNGTDIVEAVTYLASLTLGTALPVASGGTGATTASAARTALSAASSGANSDITSLTGLTTPLSVAQGGTNAITAAAARTSLSAASSGANSDITSLTGLTTALSVAQGGTNATTAAAARTSLSAASSGANSDITSLTGLTTALSVAQGGTGVTTSTGSGNNVLSTSPSITSATLITPILGTPTSGTLTNATGLPLTTGVTGTLPVGNGGTGATTLTANNVLLGNGTSAFQVVAPGTSGNILTASGGTWVSSAPTPGVPSGAVMSFAMNSAPSGWLSCDGSAVSRTTYAALFTAISTTYGTGDGSTTFNLPDLRGYFVRGSGTNSDGTASGTFGVKQADAFKDHTHTTTAVQYGGGVNVNANPGASITGNTAITSSGASTGSGTETRPANIPMLYCIKT